MRNHNYHNKFTARQLVKIYLCYPLHEESGALITSCIYEALGAHTRGDNIKVRQGYSQESLEFDNDKHWPEGPPELLVRCTF